MAIIFSALLLLLLMLLDDDSIDDDDDDAIIKNSISLIACTSLDTPFETAIMKEWQ